MPFDYDVPGDSIDFVPKWMNMRSNYRLGVEKEPVIITIRLTTMADSEEWSKRMFALQRPAGVDEEGNSQDEQALEIGKQQLISGILKIQNLKFRGVSITDGMELWGTPYKELILEVGRAIRDFNVLMEGDIKNLKRPADGSSEETTTPAPTA